MFGWFSIMVQLLLSVLAFSVLIRELSSQALLRKAAAALADFLPRLLEADRVVVSGALPQPGLLVLPEGPDPQQPVRVVLRLIHHGHDGFAADLLHPDQVHEQAVPQTGLARGVNRLWRAGRTSTWRARSTTTCGWRRCPCGSSWCSSPSSSSSTSSCSSTTSSTESGS